MITFQTSVCVKRPIEEVFAFVSDPVLFPRWNSAVQTVHQTSEERGRSGLDVLNAAPTTPRAGRERTRGLRPRAPHRVRHPHNLGPDAVSLLLPIRLRRRRQVVHLDASVELTGLPTVLGPLAARGVRRGVDANLAALKQALEASARDAQPQPTTMTSHVMD